MKIFIDLENRRLQRSLTDSTPLGQLNYKRGDTAQDEIIFVRDGTRQQLSGSPVITFAAKKTGEFDGAALVYEDGYTLTGTGSTAGYIGNPSFNTEPLDTAFGVDGTIGNDIPLLDLMGEITWNIAGVIASTETFIVRASNDVIKGAEDTPSLLPDPEEWVPEAPSDGFPYGRKDGAWARVLPYIPPFATHVTDISGWIVTGGTPSLDGSGNVTFDTPGTVTYISASSGLSADSIVRADIYPALQTLNLGGTSITTPPDLTGLTSLQTLNLNSTSITTPPDLTGLTSLQTLNLGGTSITTPPDLAGLTALEILDLNSTLITTPPDLTGLTVLTDLYLYNTLITTPPDLTGLTSLIYLYIYNTSITDPPLIDGFINQISDIPVNTGGITGGYYDLSGGSNAAPTAASLAARTNISLANDLITN